MKEKPIFIPSETQRHPQFTWYFSKLCATFLPNLTPIASFLQPGVCLRSTLRRQTDGQTDGLVQMHL